MLKLLHENQVSNIRTSSHDDLFSVCIAHSGKPEIFEKCIRNKPKITPGIVRSSRNDTTLNLSFELLFDIAIPIRHHGIEKNVQPRVTKTTPNKRLIISKPSKEIGRAHV